MFVVDHQGFQRDHQHEHAIVGIELVTRAGNGTQGGEDQFGDCVAGVCGGVRRERDDSAGGYQMS